MLWIPSFQHFAWSIFKFPLCLLVNHGHFHLSQEARKKRQELDLDYRLGRHVPRHAAVPMVILRSTPTICPASGRNFTGENRHCWNVELLFDIAKCGFVVFNNTLQCQKSPNTLVLSQPKMYQWTPKRWLTWFGTRPIGHCRKGEYIYSRMGEHKQWAIIWRPLL